MKAYQDAIQHTSTKDAPWFIVPADHKWFTRVVVSTVIVNKMESLNLQYPQVNEEHLKSLEEAKALLESE